MFDIGFLELLIVAIIGLLVLGPERLPVAARKVGHWVGKARRMVNQFSREIDRQIEADELREQLKAQGESLNIEEDLRNIQQTVGDALKEAETVGKQEAQTTPEAEEPLNEIHPPNEFEPLPRTEAQQEVANEDKASK